MSLKELFGVWGMSICSRDKVDYVQEMPEGKEYDMDAETCSELCQDNDVDGSEFLECKGGVDNHIVQFLLSLGSM